MLTGYTGWLGPYFNILPLFSVGLFLVHQQLFTPPAMDEQQEMQQKMMKFMTLFIAVLFFKVPAGLCLYFITSSLWALAERKMLPKSKTETEQTPISLAASKTAPSATKTAKAKKAAFGGNSNGAGGAAGKKSRRRKKNRR
jgi:YidC/Oxa1 family membrane protein insertase